MTELVPIWAAGISCLFTGVTALIAWGLRNQVSAQSAQVSALRSEMQLELAQAELRFYTRINGSYAKKEVIEALRADIERLEKRLDGGLDG